VIRSFGDKLTGDLYHGHDNRIVKRLPEALTKAALRKLDMVEAAHRLEDLRSPPGNRPEALFGDVKGSYGVRVNDQWRLVFRWQDGAAEDVRLTDYH
jgi:proteic killer suppression protein